MKTFINKITVLLLVTFIAGVACSDDTEIRHIIPASSIELLNVTDNTIYLEETDTFTLQYELGPEDANNKGAYKSTSFRSGDTKVFTVSSSGEIKATGLGSAILTISTGSGSFLLERKCMVEVSHKVSAIEIPERFRQLSLPMAGKLDLTELYSLDGLHDEVTMQSSDNTVATIYKGVMTGVGLGQATITIASAVKPSVSTQIQVRVNDPDNLVATYLDRTGWKVYNSLPPFVDGVKVPKDPACLFDGDDDTSFAMVKPGRNNTPAGREMSIVIDMGQSRPVNLFRIDHRKSNVNTMIRVHTASLYGSNNFEPGEGIDDAYLDTWSGDFELIQSSLETSTTDAQDQINFRELPLAITANYRYIKVVYNTWNTGSGNTIQVSEMNFGTANW